MIDVAIIGGGPAGLSAAVNVCARGASCMVISNDIASNPLAKSPRVDNYVGMRGVSGLAMLEAMHRDAEEAGAQFMRGRVLSLMPFGESFMISVGDQIVEAKRVILATGVVQPKKLEGEDALLGRGVSYCATCDGRLYRGRSAVVIGNADDLAHEVDLLRQIGVTVTVVGSKRPEALADNVTFVQAKPLAVSKEETVVLQTDGEAVSCDVVFILRNEQAMDNLMPGLATDGRFVTVDARMCTNIPGVFAAGDCTGRPLQVAKAVSDGLIAAWSATDSLKKV